MKGVILAAGKGTRLFPVTYHIPKPLLPLANRLTLEDTVGSLRALGVRFDSPLDEDAPALFVDVAGDEGPELRVGFTNFYAITRYNRSVMYALAVHDLGSRIAARLPPA